jgi:hypothetical protein
MLKTVMLRISMKLVQEIHKELNKNIQNQNKYKG